MSWHLVSSTPLDCMSLKIELYTFSRSRPVIKMDSYVTFDSESKLISLDNRNCTLSDSTRVTCFPLRACFKYSGDGVLMRHNFNIQYVLDVKKTKNPRLFFLELEGRNSMNHTITVERDRQFCRTVQVSKWIILICFFFLNLQL